MPLSKTKAVERIHLLLDDRDWEDGLAILHEIADIIRETGLNVRSESEPPQRWLIANERSVGLFWHDDQGVWNERETATIFGGEERRKRVLPSDGFWMTPQHIESLFDIRGRIEQQIVNATMFLTDQVQRDYLAGWRRLSTDERTEDMPDAEFEIVWPTTPEHPSSITVRYNVQEANDLANELAGVPSGRGAMTRQYQQRFGPLQGEHMARRVMCRRFAVPRSQRVAVWTWTQDDSRPTFTNSRFYTEGLVVEATYEGRTIRIHREGREEIRRMDNETGDYVVLPSHEASDLRELFPTGQLDDDCDLWSESHFMIYEDDSAMDSPFDLTQALRVAADRLGGVALPEIPVPTT